MIFPLTYSVSLGCSFINIGFDQKDFQGLGVFHAAVYDEGQGGNFLGCVSYSQFWQDQANDIGFKTARFAACFLLGFTTIATLICACLQCFSKHGKSHLWNVMRICYIGALASQGVMYAIFSSDMCKDPSDNVSSAQKCWLGRNGIAGVFNFILLFGMVFASFNSFPPL